MFGPAPAPTAVFSLAVKVICERRSANCRVVIGYALSTRVINRERKITNSGIRSASHIFKERGIAEGIVTESGVLPLSAKAPTASLNDPLPSVAVVIEQCGRSNSCVSAASRD